MEPEHKITKKLTPIKKNASAGRGERGGFTHSRQPPVGAGQAVESCKRINAKKDTHGASGPQRKPSRKSSIFGKRGIEQKNKSSRPPLINLNTIKPCLSLRRSKLGEG